MVYYRLRQVDFDGQYSYSEVASLMDCASTVGSIVALPNPTRGSVDGERGCGRARAADRRRSNCGMALGRVAMQKRIMLDEGRAAVQLNIAPLASGTYALVLQHGGCGPALRTRVVKR
jgi:hypothetical protein